MVPASDGDTPGPGERQPDAVAVVLDTNVVLDWLLFRDPGITLLAQRLDAGQLRWHTTAAMRTELELVSRRPQFAAWMPDCERILSDFDLNSLLCAEPPTLAGRPRGLRCRDPDDQKFIDLAVDLNATWLISKDRDLLALARPARAYGVEVLTPARWTETAAG